jgi:hypothetical protein
MSVETQVNRSALEQACNSFACSSSFARIEFSEDPVTYVQ